MPDCTADVDLAAMTHGYVGADLAALCRESAMAALRRHLAQAATGGVELSGLDPQWLLVGMEDFAAALREVFCKAHQMSPCILFLGEVDTLAPARGETADNAGADRLVGQLLTEMDGIQNLTGVLVVVSPGSPDRGLQRRRCRGGVPAGRSACGTGDGGPLA